MKNVAPQWWEITFGIILIILGISLCFLYKKSKTSVDFYKEEQLKEYKKLNPKFHGTYEQARLILPWSQRMKLLLWPLIGMSVIIVGIVFSTGMTFSFFVK